jgi:adenosylcobinamide-GDP ribazoletransferase
VKILRYLAVSFSLYSKIPMPRFKWREDDMAHSLMFFPFVGAVIAALICALNTAELFKSLPAAVRIMITILIPVAVTGGFHVDGFMDTEDALCSFASKEKKLEILKDPHIGAFAVISLVKYLLIYAAAVTAILLSEKSGFAVMVIFGMTFVISRSLSGLTSITFKKAKKEGMLFNESKNVQIPAKICLCIFLGAALFLMFSANALYGAAVTFTFALCTLIYRHRAYTEFGGVTGDTAGYFVTVTETYAAVALALVLYLS